jgi:hypothetical protein
MSNMSDYLEDKLLGVSLLGSPFTAPATVWMALATSATTDGAVFNEVPSGTAYVRQVVVFGAPAASGLSQQVANSGLITFPQATTPWGYLTHLGIYDSPTAGNQLYWGALTTPRTVITNDQVIMPANNLLISAL